MKEIGGYIELDQYHLPMLHENAISLNCGRNCLAYLIRAKGIQKMILPWFLCDSVRETCINEGVDIRYYHIDENLRPPALTPGDGEWVYIVNYYGQLSRNEIEGYKDAYGKIIIDNTQAYFDMPVHGVDTLYTCRKFFGVPDGAFLYTDSRLDEELEQDESYKRMEFILGRYEQPASKFYGLYVKNNELFATEPIKKMSRLTRNLLHGIDYAAVKERRNRNYDYLYSRLGDINQLKLSRVEGAFSYPLLLDSGAEIRKKFIREKVYIPTLWENVLDDTDPGSLEHRYAENILPLPCDQRYCEQEMQAICNLLKTFLP